MTIPNNLRRKWRTYLSGRLWAFGALLGLLSLLALIQFHWVNQVAEAERQRAKTSLLAALSNVENDFDVEITRAFAFFAAPSVDPSEYSERYSEWIRFAPYPNLVRGVYVLDELNSKALPKPLIVGEPALSSGDWQNDLAKMALPGAMTTLSRSVGPRGGVRVFSQVPIAGSFRALKSEIVIDGNPAFVFPIPPAFSTLKAAHTIGPVSRPIRLANFRGPSPFVRWGLVVLDASYVQTTLLPRLVKTHFPKAASDYDVLVVDESSEAASRVVFRSEAAPPEGKFMRPDASTKLLQLRMDCLSSSPPMRETRVVASTSGMSLLSSPDGLSEILTWKATPCALPPVGNSAGRWRMLVKYKVGSLDQAMATFRLRNLVLSGGVLIVLALGIVSLIAFTERARALAQMQTEFVLGVSHEFRTPLAVIRLAADNLKRGMVENSAEARKYGEIVCTHASELSHMVEEALAFARIESTRLVPRTIPISPEQIVRTSVANCERTLKNAGMQLEVDIEPVLPLVAVDVSLMNRCLENLIQNAVKYAETGKWLAIRVRKVNRAGGAQVQISVEDRGPGISSADLPHIFEAFYRGRQGEKSQIPGVGLGLTLVKRTIESHGGTVEVESSEFTGTSFSLFLPARFAQSELQKA